MRELLKIEDGFEKWWDEEGSKGLTLKEKELNLDQEEITYLRCREAWLRATYEESIS